MVQSYFRRKKVNQKIKVLYIAAEISPYANAGGLGEVGRSFPKALSETPEIEVKRVMPLHKTVNCKLHYVTDFPVPMEPGFETCVLKKSEDSNGIETYFIGNDRYFYRDNIYGYEDDGFRYFFFCRAVLQMLKHVKYKPDIVHVNDWHTGFLPLLIKKEFPKIKTVYTIHNISYHGFIPASLLEGVLSVPELFRLGWPEWLNFMKAGIVYSDLLTTVSTGYCQEIRQPEFSCGMASLIEQRTNEIVGILDGIDTESYDPYHDGVLAYPYNEENTLQKKKNRTELRLAYGLPDTEVPLVAMITRLEYSKGIELVFNALKRMEMNTFQLIILGTGNPYYQGMLAGIAAEYPECIIADFNYTSVAAKKIYGAADIYLMPSQNEPCGLGQLYAMRYGAVPIVNPVGGLKCTVTEDKKDWTKSSGFYMEEWSEEALSITLKRAITTYHTLDWAQYIKNCMKFDSSWNRSVSEYLLFYKNMLIKH